VVRFVDLLVAPLTYAAALGFVAAAVQLLSVDNFYRSVQLTYDIADEYLNVDRAASDADRGGNDQTTVRFCWGSHR
jgi:hypothetical protein